VNRQLLRPDEVAEMLGIGRSKVYSLIREETIPSVRIGKSIRVPAQALEEWLVGMVSQKSDA
jgi:prophage regulatory protein